jgi:O-methyltransferase
MSALSKAVRAARVAIDPRLRTVKVALANSLATPRRLINLRGVARAAAARSIPGIFVECGTFRGGSAAVIADQLARANPQLEAHLFDVFTGMPKPGEHDPREAWDDVGKFVASPDLVRQTFVTAKVPLAPDHLHIHQGLFEHTLPGFAIPKQGLSFLHVDCDWHDPVLMVIEKFFDAVNPGGTIVFDDYGHWSGCRKAVDAFLARRNLIVTLTPIDRTSHYFLKP